MWLPWLVFLAPATALPAPALPELARLAPIIGTWSSNEVTSHCDWSPDRRWIVCDQKGTVGGKTFDALSLYGYSPTTKQYVFFTEPDGAQAPFGATLKIEGKHWTYVPTNPEAAKSFRTVNDFVAPDHYDWQALQSEDGGKTWSVAMSGTSKRVK